MRAPALLSAAIAMAITVASCWPAAAQVAGLREIAKPDSLPGEIVLGEPVPARGVVPEAWVAAGEARIVHNVMVPTLTPFLPPAGQANGTAVVIAPGGAFMILSMSSEGYDVARQLASKGITAFVLKYRLLQTPATAAATFAAMQRRLSGIGSDNFEQHLDDGSRLAVEDAKEAMRVVRAGAAKWRIDPAKVGFMGFSAGAITTLRLAFEADRSAMPAFIAPIYGILDTPDRPLPKELPPMWASIATDDPLLGKSDLGLLTAWRDAGGSVEFHMYAKGGHGFGLKGTPGTTTVNWPQHFLAWLQTRGLYLPKD